MTIISGKVSKIYNIAIFSSVPIQIDEGEIYLVIGRNGVGKSTLLRLLAKVEKQTLLPLKKHDIPSCDISYMQSDLVYYHYMTVNDLIQFYNETHSGFSIEYARNHLNAFKIDLDKKIKKLSKGESKILAFTICLSFEKRLYVIDEPFPNVDLLNDELFRKMIIERYDEHKTFIIATHQINELEKISSKCIVIKNRTTIDILNTDEIRSKTALSVEDYFKEALK